MKLNLTWQQVVFFTVLVGAPIVAHVVAPGAATAVTGMVSTALGFLFGDARRNKEEEKGAAQ